MNVINLTLPPMRERREDIPELARYFLKKYGQKLSKDISGFTAEALEALTIYHWPGNVREMENIIERAVILCESGKITPDDLSIPSVSAAKETTPDATLEKMEKEHILRVLRESGGNQSKASQTLGIDRKTLYLKLKKYDIDEAIKK